LQGWVEFPLDFLPKDYDYSSFLSNVSRAGYNSQMKGQTLFDERYKKLNAAQKKAVDSIEGPLLVVAGPGSGKTEILSLRVGNILRQTDTLPSNILCLTFTESAALNMRDRLSRLIGQEAYRVGIHTFHNFCVGIIQKYPEFFYEGAFFMPADELSQLAILEDIFNSLSHDHPLRAHHPEQGFVYIKAVLHSIGSLKKAGLTPQEFKAILAHNVLSADKASEILAPVFGERLSKKEFGTIAKAADQLEKASETLLKKELFPSSFFHPLLETISLSLKHALGEAEKAESTKPLSVWKEKMMKRTDDGERVFKDALNLEKMNALADLYAQYREAMHKLALFDFDDMILDVIAAIEKHPRLRYELQEQHQYVLVDEFQDTNEAQMRLLRLLSDAPVNEGHPNVMVVGDDDQAVYKFQGAELSNIMDFQKVYKDVTMVTMTDNYRSTQPILDIASYVIKKGENRLENLIPELEKTLVASHPDLKSGSINHSQFKTSLHEYHYVSREIKKLLGEGYKAEDIAVISRKHRQLESLVPYLQGAGVPIRYEREQNVFLEPHIRQLIIMARFVASLNSKGRDEADEYMPALLSFPFWGISREIIWQISLSAGRGEMNSERWASKPWIGVMLAHADPKVRSIGQFLLELSVKAQAEPLEKVLDMMIGAHVVLMSESEDEDEDATSRGLTSAAAVFTSPFKDYYFSKERFEHARTEYLSFLSSLRVFIRALREYKGNEMLVIEDLVQFVDLHEKNSIALNDKSPFASAKEAVSLLTAHKAKGLEFETVFVLSCQDEVWAGRGLPNKLSFPLNLPIEPAGDTEDDQLRLFYVALTRAKRYLYLTSYEVREDGVSSSALRFLLPKEGEQAVLSPVSPDAQQAPETHEVLTASWLKYHTPPFLGEEEALLRVLLENYQLSVTHLNNFLNVTKGGPQTFLEQNLLRFPQGKTASGSYGSAIHRTLEKLSIEFRRQEKVPPLKEMLDWFDEYLRRERLSRNEFKLYRARGEHSLSAFYEKKKIAWNEKDKTEVNFKDQGVLIGEAHITGKIDRIVDMDAGIFEVHDYKTGKAKEEWQGKDDFEKIKLHEYERQLIFYKLLVEHSRDYGRYKVERGVLEFVEPLKGDMVVDLALDIEPEKVERTKMLIEKVFAHIMNLDFPDVSRYSSDLKGILEFEEDLLSG
jgi:DNA helicase-2/ATP-dependent DNA helicase PcrA